MRVRAAEALELPSTSQVPREHQRVQQLVELAWQKCKPVVVHVEVFLSSLHQSQLAFFTGVCIPGGEDNIANLEPDNLRYLAE